MKKKRQLCLAYRFSHKDFGKAPDQNYPQAYNSTLRTNFYLGTQSKIFMTKSVVNHTLRLTKEEEILFNELIEKDTIYKEAKMLETIKDVGIEYGSTSFLIAGNIA